MGVDPQRLRRSLNLRTVVSTSAGLTFASSTFLMVIQVGYRLPGNAVWLPIVIAGVLCALAAAAFSELNGMYPSAAGIRLYIHRAFGERAAILTSLTYMSVVTLVVGTEAYVLSHVLNEAVPAIKPPIWIVLMLTIASAANLRGVKVAGAFQDIITYSVVASLVTMAIVGLAGGHVHATGPPHTAGFVPIFNSVGFAIFLFVGFEWVTPLSEEVRNPRSIPIGMFVALGMLVVVYSLIATSMFAVGYRQMLFGTELQRQPIPHVVWASLALGPVGYWCMIVTSLFMSLTTFNAGLMSVSRFVYASAREHVLPRKLEHVSSRFATPDAAVLAIYLVALVISLMVYYTGRYVILINLAAATECFIYAVAGACVIRLRLREPDRERPFRMVGGVALPGVIAALFLVIGVGVFASRPFVDYWGAAVLLVLFMGGWAAYVHSVVMPQKERARAEQALRRKSRRPTRLPSQEPGGAGDGLHGTGGGAGDGPI